MAAAHTAARALAIAASVATATLAAAPASGAATGHTSCKSLGALNTSEAHDKTLASEVRGLAHGTVDDLISLVQTGGTIDGEVIPPFCTPK